MGHQGIGALLLASAVVLALRCWRHGDLREKSTVAERLGVERGLEVVS